jgi:hypothetical protein
VNVIPTSQNQSHPKLHLINLCIKTHFRHSHYLLVMMGYLDQQ